MYKLIYKTNFGKPMKLKLLFTFLLAVTMLSVSIPSITAQQRTEDLKATVYPSEIKDNHFYVNIPESSELNEIDIKVVNLLGSEVNITITKTVDGKFRVDFESLPSGIYIVRITKDRKQSTQRIVVRNN